MSDSKSSQSAFRAISDEAEKLLGLPIDGEIRAAVERIISIARYQVDVRTAVEEERERSQ